MMLLLYAPETITKSGSREFEVVYISLRFTLIYMQINSKQKETKVSVFDLLPFKSQSKSRSITYLPDEWEITEFMSTRSCLN